MKKYVLFVVVLFSILLDNVVANTLSTNNTSDKKDKKKFTFDVGIGTDINAHLYYNYDNDRNVFIGLSHLFNRVVETNEVFVKNYEYNNFVDLELGHVFGNGFMLGLVLSTYEVEANYRMGMVNSETESGLGFGAILGWIFKDSFIMRFKTTTVNVEYPSKTTVSGTIGSFSIGWKF